MENYQFAPSEIYIPPEPTPEEVAIYGQTKEVVYKRETSNGLYISANVCHYRDFSTVTVRVTDEEYYVNAIEMRAWGTGHERYSEQLALSYLEGPELPSVCADFYDRCICIDEDEV